ncbi:hypothetical protein WMY93_015154 [Mugilogobius chulae]|uniref:ZP domain-containing protein n=1 Tax=Mugilogobius chulae TaxID=88201 RepID=A0AAW0P0S9_9GOBI
MSYRLLWQSVHFTLGRIQPNSNGDWSLVSNGATEVTSKDQNLPVVTPPCAVVFTKDNQKIVLAPYKQALLLVLKNLDVDNSKTWTTDPLVSGVKRDSFTTADKSDLFGGCRKDGQFYTFGPPNNDPATCTTTTCSVETELTVTTCDGVCNNGQCTNWKKYTCVVTPNTVIDSSGTRKNTDNFCDKTLLSNTWITLTSHYKPRRLNDIPFVEKLTFKLPTGDPLQLTNSGKVVKTDSTVVTIGDTPTAVDGLSFQKAAGGVVATFTKTDEFELELFYDGTIGHISYKALVDVTGSDLCTENGQVQAITTPENCDQVTKDPNGEGIDSQEVSTKCSVLTNEPFKSCTVDSTPYIASCTYLLSNYPDKDDFLCNIQDAFARSCGIENWMEAAGCSPSECLNIEPCIDDNEFCGLSRGREAKCLCRAPYAAPYLAKNTYGDDTDCSSKSASISLVGCLLEDKNIDITNLHLNDETCKGVKDPETHKVTFSFDSTKTCKATVTPEEGKIVYSNVIVSGAAGGTISRDDSLSITFSCAYNQPTVKTFTLKILSSSVVDTIDGGEWVYTMTMSIFTDDQLRSALDPATEVLLDRQLWVQVKATDLDEKFVSVVMEDCWATMENNAQATKKYSLVKAGCSDEASVTVVSNGESAASVFSFKVFQHNPLHQDLQPAINTRVVCEENAELRCQTTSCFCPVWFVLEAKFVLKVEFIFLSRNGEMSVGVICLEIEES